MATKTTDQIRYMHLPSETLKQNGFTTSDGRFWSCLIDGYSIDFLLRSSEKLTLCFDHAGPARRKADTGRVAWGYRFLEKHTDHSGLFIKPVVSDWFRGQELFHFLSALNKDGLFDAFNSVMTYGGSMGGYGAIAFADLCKAQKVLAYNPQATLNPKKVPWERRFNWAPKQDWEGPLWNAADGCQAAQQVVLVFDPHHGNDRQHVALLDVPGRIDLLIPYVGHRTPLHVKNMGLSAQLFKDVADGTFEHAVWRGNMRRRRFLEVYYNGMVRHASRKKHEKFLPVIESYRLSNTAKVDAAE